MKPDTNFCMKIEHGELRCALQHMLVSSMANDRNGKEAREEIEGNIPFLEPKRDLVEEGRSRIRN